MNRCAETVEICEQPEYTCRTSRGRSRAHAPRWRNWQTQGTQNPPTSRSSGFDPRPGHVVPFPYRGEAARRGRKWRVLQAPMQLMGCSSMAERSTVNRVVGGSTPPAPVQRVSACSTSVERALSRSCRLACRRGCFPSSLRGWNLDGCHSPRSPHASHAALHTPRAGNDRHATPCHRHAAAADARRSAVGR